MSLDYKILGQDLISYTTGEGTTDTTSYYVTYEETLSPRYVGLGAILTGLFMYSDDGINWQSSTTPEYGYYTSIAYGNGVFVASDILGGASFLVSEDGITWTIIQYQNITSIAKIRYLDNQFIALIQDGNIATSLDGLTWQVSTSLSSSYSWQDIAYGNGYYVAVASDFIISGGTRISYSTDLISWSDVQVPASSGLYDITFGNNTFVATDGGSRVVYASSPTSWTGTDVGWSSPTHIEYLNGIFFVPTSSNIYYSYDGASWNTNSTSLITNGGSGYSWGSVSFLDGKFVAVGDGKWPDEPDPGSGVAAYSTDGINWTRGTGSIVRCSVGAAGQITSLSETLNIIGGQGTSQTEEFLPVTIYTVPAGKQTTVTSVYVANQNSTETTYDFAVVPSGEELSLKHHLRWDMPIAANDFEVINTKITMSAGDKLVIFPSTVDTVSVTAFGVEK